ncbi:MAG: hypothetical protein R3B81_13855 [bacterium]
MRSIGMAIALALGSLVPASAESGDARALLDRMIEAHGGYEDWANAPSIRFEDRWSNGREFAVTTEPGSRRAYLESPDGATRIAWDGEQCWSLGYDGKAPPRFLYNLTWYFVNLPWVTRDPGVVLAEPREERLFDAPTPSLVVRMTYEPGVGDTPRDWYDLFLDPATFRLQACRYVVTYGALLPPGVESTPPHVLVYEDWTIEDGLMVPTRFVIREEDGAEYARCEISGWSFREPFEASRLAAPPGAVVDRSEP